MRKSAAVAVTIMEPIMVTLNRRDLAQVVDVRFEEAASQHLA
jgi:hypothetical protein